LRGLSRIRRRRAVRLRLGIGAIAARPTLGRLIAAGFPDRIAQRRGEPGSSAWPVVAARNCRSPIRCRARKLLAVASWK